MSRQPAATMTCSKRSRYTRSSSASPATWPSIQPAVRRRGNRPQAAVPRRTSTPASMASASCGRARRMDSSTALRFATVGAMRPPKCSGTSSPMVWRGTGFSSTSVTCTPPPAAVSAAEIPAGPAPMMSRSVASSMGGCLPATDARSGPMGACARDFMGRKQHGRRSMAAMSYSRQPIAESRLAPGTGMCPAPASGAPGRARARIQRLIRVARAHCRCRLFANPDQGPPRSSRRGSTSTT